MKRFVNNCGAQPYSNTCKELLNDLTGFHYRESSVLRTKVLITSQNQLCLLYLVRRGGVEDTRLEAEAKVTKKNPRPRPRTTLSRTEPLEAKDRNAQGQGPTTQAQVLSKKQIKKVFKEFFQAISKRGKQKRSSQIFREVSGVFQQNFSNSKNSGVLEPRTGQFSRT